MKSIISVLMLVALTSGVASGNSGTIHFRGSIVEPPCELSESAIPAHLNVSCFHNSTTVQRTVAINRLAHYRTPGPARVVFTVRWLNSQQTRAIVEMRYN